MSVITHNSSDHPVPLWVDRRAALGVAALLAGFLVTGQGRQVAAQEHQRGRPHHLKSPVVVVRSHSQAVTAVLATAVDLQSTLYPALPGVNRLSLRVIGARSMGMGTAGVLTLRVLMPGMTMRPIDVALHEQARQYRIPYPTGAGRAAYAVKDDLAAAVAGALVGEGYEDRVYHLTGPRALSTADLHDIVARVTGVEVVYHPADDADYLAASPGTPAAFVTLYHAVREGFADVATDHIAVLSGRQPESLEEYLQRRWAARAGEGDR